MSETGPLSNISLQFSSSLNDAIKCEPGSSLSFYSRRICSQTIGIRIDDQMIGVERINKFNFRYSLGESLNLNCSSEATLPPANLTWYINQKPVYKMFYYQNIFSDWNVCVFSLSGFPRSAHQIPDHQHDSGEGGDSSHCGAGTQTQSHEVRANLLVQPLFSRNQPMSKHLICLDRMSGTGRLWR